MRKSNLEILWQDERLVAVSKPAGLATIPGRGEKDCILELLARLLGLPCRGQTDPRLRLVHRLDKETSGVLLMAKDKDAQRHLSHQFQNNTVEKEYLAIVAGRDPAPEGQIEALLRADKGGRCMVIDASHGRPARTCWRVEERFSRATLLRVFPKTGKTHQIRVHLKSLGMGLVVDPLYNPPAPGLSPGLFLSHFKRDYRPAKNQEERPLIGRLTLHAEKLRFENLDGQRVEIVAPLPKDFHAALNMLRKYR